MIDNWPQLQADKFFETIRIVNFAVNSQGQLVFTTNIKGEYDLWGMDIPTNYPYPLTFNGQMILFPTFSPDGSIIAFSSDLEGDESYQIYMIKGEGSEPIRITEDGTRNEVNYITEDGKVYYTSNQDNPRYLTIFYYDLAEEEHYQLFPTEELITVERVFEEEGYLHYTNFYSHTNIESWLYNLETDEQILLALGEERHRSGEVVFINESQLVFVTDYGEDDSYLMKYDLAAKEFSTFLKEDGQINDLVISPDKRWLTYLVSKGVEDYLYLYNLETDGNRQIQTEATVIKQIEPGKIDSYLYFLGSSATMPENIYRYEMPTDKIEKLTDNRIPLISQDKLVEPETIRYSSFDGLEIEGLIYRAKSQNNGHWIVYPHGGPQSAERKFYRGLLQYLLANGYNIFAPNFRGSTCYGSQFMKMVEQDWGDGPRRDIISGVNWLVKEGYADSDKLFVMGGSYGGYLSLLLHGRHPELWKGVVDQCGMTDLISYIESVPEHWKSIMKERLGDIEEDRDKLIKDSPITYIEEMRQPTLIIQGANDPRVPRTESDQMVERFNELGYQVEYKVFADEGHICRKKNNRIEEAELILNFLNSNL